MAASHTLRRTRQGVAMDTYEGLTEQDERDLLTVEDWEGQS